MVYGHKWVEVIYGQSRTNHRSACHRGRRARRQAETRARILHAALDLFARQGFFSTTVEQITEAADVGKGTFFNYFPSKEHVLAGFGEVQIAKVRAARDEARRGETPMRQIWHKLLRELAQEPVRSPGLLRSLIVVNLAIAIQVLGAAHRGRMRAASSSSTLRATRWAASLARTWPAGARSLPISSPRPKGGVKYGPS